IVVATETIITVIVEILVITDQFLSTILFAECIENTKYLSVYDERSNVLIVYFVHSDFTRISSPNCKVLVYLPNNIMKAARILNIFLHPTII
ncbi:MAG: hypothetical protein WCF23_10550, partial [Candidatus Nitrosopolaris sp.]